LVRLAEAVKVSAQNLSVQTLQNIFGRYCFTITGMWIYNFVKSNLLGKNLRTIIMVGFLSNCISKFFVVLFLLVDDLNGWFNGFL
jgi:hypothetical protein